MTKIIAELGTLNLTSYSNLMDATKACMDAGAHGVKVQLIKAENAWWASERQKIRYRFLEWSIGEWAKYFEECRKRFDRPVFPSIFDTSYLVEDITGNVPCFKLGWKANMMPELIERTFEYCKPVLWSLNGTEYWRHGLKSDLRMGECEPLISRRIYALTRSPLTTRLYVQTQYPTPDSEIVIPDFGKEYHGLSAHYANSAKLYEALIKEPKYLEVHVKTESSNGPDTDFAIDLTTLESLVMTCAKQSKDVYEKRQ